MDVVIANELGFCFGVRRAIALVNKTLDKYFGRRICIVGDLIHNNQVVDELKEKGISMINSAEELKKGDVLIIRSHGESPEAYQHAKKLSVEIVDATCPHVLKAQSAGKEMHAKGYDVIIIGKHDHPEVRAMADHSNSKTIISGKEEVRKKISKNEKIGVISQTTILKKSFDEISSEILKQNPNAKIVNTLCSATSRIQKAALKLAEKVNMMIVIGGYHSSNTTELARLCKGVVLTHHIEKKDDLRKEWFNGISKVGITAGTSTPQGSVNEVFRVLKDENFKNN